MGIWLGLPGRYEQSIDELDKSLDKKGRRKKRKKRAISPLAWAQRSSREANRQRGSISFDIKGPDED